MWRSINDSMTFAMKDVISGKLFEVECKYCGKKVHVDYPILVNDMAHDVMIYYTYPDGTEEVEMALKSMDNMYNGRTRIVTDQESLREKVAIFNADLDDRVVELIKAIVMAQVRDQLADKEIQGVYFISGDNPSLEIVSDEGLAHLPVKMEFYDKIKNSFFKNGELTQDKEIYVDRDWAYSVLNLFEL